MTTRSLQKGFRVPLWRKVGNNKVDPPVSRSDTVMVKVLPRLYEDGCVLFITQSVGFSRSLLELGGIGSISLTQPRKGHLDSKGKLDKNSS